MRIKLTYRYFMWSVAIAAIALILLNHFVFGIFSHYLYGFIPIILFFFHICVRKFILKR